MGRNPSCECSIAHRTNMENYNGIEAEELLIISLNPIGRKQFNDYDNKGN